MRIQTPPHFRGRLAIRPPSAGCLGDTLYQRVRVAAFTQRAQRTGSLIGDGATPRRSPDPTRFRMAGRPTHRPILHGGLLTTRMARHSGQVLEIATTGIRRNSAGTGSLARDLLHADSPGSTISGLTHATFIHFRLCHSPRYLGSSSMTVPERLRSPHLKPDGGFIYTRSDCPFRHGYLG